MFRSLQRWALTLVGVLLAVPAHANETPMLINIGAGGGWAEAATSGQGFAFDVVPESNQMVAYWFTYPQSAGTHEWFVAQGDISGNSADLVIYRTRNGVFDQPSDIELEVIGTAFLEYQSCRAARFDYFFEESGITGEFMLERVGTTQFCEQFLATASLDAVSSGNAWFTLGGEWVFEGCVPLDDGTSHGEELLTFKVSGMTLEIVNYESPDCSGPATLQTLELDMQRVDKTMALLAGEEVIANRYILSDALTGNEIRQLWYVDDSGDVPLVAHGILGSPLDEEGFPTQLHDRFFLPALDD